MNQRSLPPGQHSRPDFPRFGLDKYANRFPDRPDRVAVSIEGSVANPFVADRAVFETLPRIEQISDFHCVTTWSRTGVRWSGFRFGDFFRLAVERGGISPHATVVVLRCQDGYRTCLSLDDLLASDVLFADRLDDEPLSIAHGAPLRLVAPAHYGYKNPKHLEAVEFWPDTKRYRPAGFAVMDHPRARVQFEERGRVLPGWMYRVAYRPLIGPTVRKFARALKDHLPTRQRS